MKAIKKAIHLNSEDLEQINKLGKLLGFGTIESSYGLIPKVLKFSNTLTLETIKQLDKVIPPLKEPEIDVLFQSIKNYRKEQERLKTIESLQNEAKK